MGPGEFDGLEPSEEAVDAVSAVRSATEDELLAGVVCAVVTGVTDASVTVRAEAGWVTGAGCRLL